MHWACALGHVDYLASLNRLPIKLVNNARHSPLAFAVTRQDNYTRQTFAHLQQFYGVEPCRDAAGRTFFHTIVARSVHAGNALVSRYYLECVADWIDRSRDADVHAVAIENLLDAQVCIYIVYILLTCIF